jgi:uncharacterized protein (DUF2235 family)
MTRNIVICSDGTGNTFGDRVSNVTHLVKLLELDGHQMVMYDQGIGTSAAGREAVKQYARSLDDPAALVPLPALESKSKLTARWERARGQLFGYGLKENVREMYVELAKTYAGPNDRVFLFGFSRGAFTVRVLAGLLYRCHLPLAGTKEPGATFERAWELFVPIQEDETETERFRATQRPCPVHFIGVWDTVKSYGGLNPVLLPHLRHNPIVTEVRHALALHERRAWFKPTTWGRLDRDQGEGHAMSRFLPDAFENQTIAEVWFAGTHSGVGGGDSDRDGKEKSNTATISLRWMLGEIVSITEGLRLNERGKAFLNGRDPEPKDSWHLGWWFIEQIPRAEINNDGVYPSKLYARGSNGVRDPEEWRRDDGKVFVHATALKTHSASGGVVPVETRAG